MFATVSPLIAFVHLFAAEVTSSAESLATSTAATSESTSAGGERVSADASGSSGGGSWNVPASMRPGTRPHVFEVGFGPYGPWWGAELSYLYHLSGGPTGPALGAVGSVGAGWGGASFSAGGKFQWDFALFPSQPIGLYLGPFATVAYQHVGAIRTDMGAHARLLFLDRWCVYVQPVVVGMYFFPGDADYRGRNFWPTYHAAIGGGVTF